MPQEDSIEEMICELKYYKDTIQIARGRAYQFYESVAREYLRQGAHFPTGIR